MISATEFKKGIAIKVDNQLWTIADFQFVKPGKGTAFVRTKLKSLLTGNVIEKSFKSHEEFEEVEMEKKKVKFLYSHRDKICFSEENNPSARFEVGTDLIGSSVGFLKPNEIVDALYLEGKLTSISLPIKTYLKVTEAPPSFKGDTAQGGMKSVKLETGAYINAPLFVEVGDILEINTDTGEYVKRVEQER